MNVNKLTNDGYNVWYKITANASRIKIAAAFTNNLLSIQQKAIFKQSSEIAQPIRWYRWPPVRCIPGKMAGSIKRIAEELYVPIDGVVSWRFEERLGSQVWIRSDEYPDFQIGIFHIRLQDSTLSEGRVVKAGQLLGTHFAYLFYWGSKTSSDIAVTVETPRGRKLVSCFDIMTDALFQRYQSRGLINREDVIISKQTRDAHPLTCSGETFISGMDVLEEWVILN